MDSEFYNGLKVHKYDEHNKIDLWSKWLSFKGIRVFLTPMEIKEFGKEVYLVRRNWKPSINRENLDNGIYGGRNSGLGAISLAIALGANPIYLLGYDMQAINSTHWHGGYDNRKIEDFNRKLQEYKDEISKFALLIDTYNIQIFNLNRDSSLKCFTPSNIDNILKG
jgi:hypothetical protein